MLGVASYPMSLYYNAEYIADYLMPVAARLVPYQRFVQHHAQQVQTSGRAATTALPITVTPTHLADAKESGTAKLTSAYRPFVLYPASQVARQVSQAQMQADAALLELNRGARLSSIG